MNILWEKIQKKQIYYLASLIFILIGLVYFFSCLQRPFVGLDIKNSDGQWVVVTADPNGEGYRSGIRAGDQIFKINSQDAGDYPLLKKWGLAEGANSISVSTKENTIEQTITIENQSTQTMLAILPFFILGFIFWFLGFLAWLKRPFLVQARALFWLNYFIGLAILLSKVSSRGLFLGKELQYIAFLLTAVALVYFFSIFPQRNNNKIDQLGCRLITLLAAIFFILLFIHSIGFFSLSGFLVKLALFTTVISILFVVVNLILLKSSKDQAAKNEVNIILLGLLIGFLPFFLITALPALFDFKQLVYTYVNSFFSQLLISVVPFSLYYVVVKKYLPDYRRIYEEFISQILSSVCLSFILLLALYLLKIVPSITFEVYIELFFSIYILIACYHYLQVILSKLFKKSSFLQKKQSFKQKIKELNENLTSLIADDQVLMEMAQNLEIDGIFLITNNVQFNNLNKAVGRFQENHKEREILEEYFNNHNQLDMETKILPDDFPAEVFVPFSSNNSACGIFFGHRFSRIKFIQPELSFLTLLAGQLVYQLLILIVINGLNKELIVLNERINDSKTISETEIENTIPPNFVYSLFANMNNQDDRLIPKLLTGPYHYVLDQYSWLDYLQRKNLPENIKQQTMLKIGEIDSDIKFGILAKIDKRNPPLLDKSGLLPTIELWIQDFMREELALIILNTFGLENSNRFDKQIETVAFRFIEKGIINALRYSESHVFKVDIILIKNILEIIISDNGKGFDVNKLETWLISGAHSGLAVMKKRIESVEGQLEITSQINKGTTLKALFQV
ncbi:sensor histidine kinase [Dehalobacter restrictus]|uniref:Histidine kinase n=1 Tax=Dehalobacter restrictus TaxID=55583 RepID=A0A857DHV7_9FIRM|nr:ATP-binding protein [Dehalobacter restrictus]QHA00089.1 histidine kinase [Dehalobacter restrictus]